MRRCPYCAEDIQTMAIRCKHCRSDLEREPALSPGAGCTAPRVSRGPRLLALGLLTVTAVALGGPVVARPVLQRLGAGRCQPTNLVEWHAAIHDGCLQPSYVCEHMTTPSLLADPEVARSFPGGRDSNLAEMVGRMRRSFGCAPESGAMLQGGPYLAPTPQGTVGEDAPRTL